MASVASNKDTSSGQQGENKKGNGNMIVQTLGGHSYELRSSPISPWYQRAFRTIFKVAVSPFVASAALLWSAALATPWRNTLLGLVLPQVLKGLAREFRQERQTLLQHVSGRVVDVGSGSGNYLEYCQKADEVVAVEPIVELHPAILEKGQKYARHLTIVRDLSEVVDKEAPESFDWIILGNVLCEVPNIPLTLQQAHTLLKPGGHVYFSEHVGRPQGTWIRFWQNRLNPWWHHCSGGCNCNRDSLVEIQKYAPQQWDIIYWTYEHFHVIMGSFIMGLAQKKVEPK